MKKTSYTLITFLLLFIFIESVLQIGGAFLQGNQQISSHKDKILCIGESTTAPFWADNKDSTWTAHLQSRLDEKYPEKYEVINLGIGGITSYFMAKNIRSQLEKYKPKFVITMIGINEGWIARNFSMEYKNEFKVNDLLYNLKFFKLLKWVFERIRYNHLPIDESYFIHSNLDNTRTFIEKTPIPNNLEGIVQHIQRAYHHKYYIQQNKDSSQDFFRVEDLYNITIKASYKGLKINKHPWFLDKIIDANLFLNNKKGCLNALNFALDNNITISSLSKINLIGCYNINASNRAEWSDKLDLNFTQNSFTQDFANNYLYISQQIQSSGAKHIVMNYANLPVENVKYIFSKNHHKTTPPFSDVHDRTWFNYRTRVNYNKDIIFLNHDNFLKDDKYSDVFYDILRPRTGHLTSYGHKKFGYKVADDFIEMLESQD